jgi:serine/threonine-protein kinase RsbW
MGDGDESRANPARFVMRDGEDHGVVALSIPAKAEYIVLCRLALAGVARIRALEPETVADLKLALTEACSNSIRHAYAHGRTGAVEIRYELNGEKFQVEVADDGSGFDVAALGEPDADPEEGGLGLAIIRALTDELAIESDGHGSRLRFTKYLG